MRLHARLFMALMLAAVLGGCYTTGTKVIQQGTQWPALIGTYDVTIRQEGQAPQHKVWTFQPSAAGESGHLLAGVAPEPLEVSVAPLYEEARLIQVADGRGKHLLMVVRPTAEGFDVLLHDGIEKLAKTHGVEAVPLDLGYQLNGPADAILSLLQETRGREARPIMTAVRR